MTLPQSTNSISAAARRPQALADFMELRPGMHLLDVGCGIGGPARYFAERGCQVTGIDLTEEFVRVAESLTRMVKLDQSTRNFARPVRSNCLSLRAHSTAPTRFTSA